LRRLGRRQGEPKTPAPPKVQAAGLVPVRLASRGSPRARPRY